MSIVRIEWSDSKSYGTWKKDSDLVEILNENEPVFTVGHLVAEDERHIVVAQNICGAHYSSGHTRIDKKLIKEITEL